MTILATVVYAIHTLFELLFGTSAYLSGASSSQSAEDRATQPVELKIAFRFMGSALFALGVLGAIVLFGPGVGSPTAKYVAIGLAIFHGLGVIGSVWTSAPGFRTYCKPLAFGAVIVHGSLALGFAVVALG